MLASARRITRPQQHRDDNDAYARQYGKVLRGHLALLADEPSPTASLHGYIEQMHAVAQATFPAAYLRGKRQAIGPIAKVGILDQRWIDKKLTWNQAYLRESLMPDILAKAQRQQLHLIRNPVERRELLDKSFGSRLEDLYGGTLWTVTEAGFRSGAIALNAHHMYPSVIGQEEPTQAQEADPYIDVNGNLVKKGWLAVVSILLKESQEEVEKKYTKLHFGISYNTADDGDVCPPCLNAAGEYESPDQAPLPGQVCVIGDTRIDGDGIQVVSRRSFEGRPLCRITTLGGRVLTCTPDHPVLTRNGWVPADQLREGMDLVCNAAGDLLPRRNPNVQNVPSTIDQLFRAASDSRPSKRMDLLAVDLDGKRDGDNQINRQGVNGALLDYGEVKTFQQGGEFGFSATNGRQRKGLRSRAFSQGGGSMVATAPSDMGSLGLPSFFLFGHPLVFEALSFLEGTHNAQGANAASDYGFSGTNSRCDHGATFSSVVSLPNLLHRSVTKMEVEWHSGSMGGGFADRSAVNSSSTEARGNRRTRDTELASKLILGSSFQVAFDEVANVELQSLSRPCHVYNLQTADHWYLTNGIVSHNCEGFSRCRCWLTLALGWTT